MPVVEEGGIDNHEDLLEEIQERLPHIARPYWLPDFVERPKCWQRFKKRVPKRRTWEEEATVAEGGGTRLKSKFGGSDPWLDPEVGWPRCPECRNPKSFICQLVVSELPKEIKTMLGRSDGLFQCFTCLDHIGEADADAVFIDQDRFTAPPSLKMLSAQVAAENMDVLEREAETIPKRLRSYLGTFDLSLVEEGIYNCASSESDSDSDEDLPSPKRRKTSFAKPKAKKTVKWFRENIITTWMPGDHAELPLNRYEFPDYQDEITAALEINRHFLEGLENFEDVYEPEDERLACTVKLGGYFPWIVGHPNSTGKDYPECKKCEVEMNQTFLLLRESDVLNHEWGEDGMAFVSICPKCKAPKLDWASI